MSPKTITEAAQMALAVSTVIFAVRPCADGTLRLWAPLVRRTRQPFLGQWALPGGWVGIDESLEGAGSRTLRETTGLRPTYLEQLYTFGALERSAASEDGRVISVVYFALVRNDEAAQAIEDDNVRWFNVNDLPSLAFDHQQIVEYALWRLRTKTEYAHVAMHFLGDLFTLGELREIYEAILERKLDPANFRRRVEATGTIVPTSERVTGGRHRPPRLYRTDPNAVHQAAKA